jgi:hypothetical protein
MDEAEIIASLQAKYDSALASEQEHRNQAKNHTAAADEDAKRVLRYANALAALGEPFPLARQPEPDSGIASPRMRQNSIKGVTLRLLKEDRGPWTATLIHHALLEQGALNGAKNPLNAIRTALWELRKDGLVRSAGRGLNVAVEHDDRAAPDREGLFTENT